MIELTEPERRDLLQFDLMSRLVDTRVWRKRPDVRAEHFASIALDLWREGEGLRVKAHIGEVWDFLFDALNERAYEERDDVVRPEVVWGWMHRFAKVSANDDLTAYRRACFVTGAAILRKVCGDDAARKAVRAVWPWVPEGEEFP